MISNRTNVRVRYADTDQMRIVYHARYLEWFEMGRTELLREIGLPYAKLEGDGILLPVLEAYCYYKIPARYDQLLTIISKIREVPRARIKIDYEIYDDKDRLLVYGHTSHFFMSKNGRPMRPPQYFVDLLSSFFSREL